MTPQSPSFRRSKSILKRPTPLTSPFDVHSDAFPFATCVTIQFSPALYSPHVHFPSTPTLTFTQPTHSAAIYDRAPILVSPNLLEIPEWGARIYSPSLGTFRFSKPSSPDVPSDPPFSSSEDSDSPKSSLDADDQNSVRLRAKTTSTGSPTVDEIRSFLPYPRSPLPRSPLKDVENSGPVTKTKKGTNRDAQTRRGKPRSYKNGTRRKLKGLDLLHVPVANHFSPQKTSSTILQQLDSILSPVQESVSPPSNSDSSSSGSGGRPSSRLRKAFWQSVSIQEHVDATSSCEYPDTMLSPIPHFTFGRCDGVLWSPGLPRKSREESDTDRSSPSGNTFFSVEDPQLTPQVDVTSPSPNDPLSNLPSFSTVLESGGLIQYPPPVHLPDRGVA